MTTDSVDTEKSRYDVASGILDEIFGPEWRDKTKVTGVKAVDDFQRITVEHCYADAWARDALDFKTRSVISLTTVATMGALDEVKLHVEAALANGHSMEDIFEILLHLIPYIGVPKAVHALRAAGDAFQEIFSRGSEQS